MSAWSNLSDLAELTQLSLKYLEGRERSLEGELRQLPLNLSVWQVNSVISCLYQLIQSGNGTVITFGIEQTAYAKQTLLLEVKLLVSDTLYELWLEQHEHRTNVKEATIRERELLLDRTVITECLIPTQLTDLAIRHKLTLMKLNLIGSDINILTKQLTQLIAV